MCLNICIIKLSLYLERFMFREKILNCSGIGDNSMKYVLNKGSIVCEEFLVSETYQILKYNKTCAKPIVDFTHDNFFKTQLQNQFNNINHVAYIRFDIECEEETFIVLSIYGNYNDMKIWVNYDYKGYFKEWTKRKIIKVNKGLNIFIIEVKITNLNSNIRFYLTPIKKQHQLKIEDDYNDIKNNYLIVEKGDKEDTIRFIVVNDNEMFLNKVEEIKVITPRIDFNKRVIDYIILDTFNIRVYEEKAINISKYKKNCSLMWFFINVLSQNQRIFVSSSETALHYLLNEIRRKKNVFTIWEYNNLFKVIRKYLKRDDLPFDIKYYFCYNELNKIFENEPIASYKDFLLVPGFKEISYISSIDKKEIYYGLYIPINFNSLKELDLIILLSSHGYKTYIESYFQAFPNDYIIVEFSLRGNNFGNYIGEQIFLEILNKLKQIYKTKQITRVFLMGYSSCASAVISLMGKYPSLIDGGLAIAGQANRWLLNNINNNGNLIIISGSFDIDVKKLYYLNEQMLLNKTGNVQNVLLEGYDHTTIAVFMRNKNLIKKVLELPKVTDNNLKYYGISEFYQTSHNIKVLSRITSDLPYYCEIVKNIDCINIITRNVKTIMLIPTNKMNDFIINNNKVKLSKRTAFSLLSVPYNKIRYCDFSFINNGMGLLNIYNFPIMFWLNHSFDQIENIKGLYKPSNMTRAVSNAIEYPYKIVDQKDILRYINIMKKQCNVFYNLQSSNINIKPKKDGFIYMNTFYLCKYSIIQIVPNQYNKRYYNVFVNDNDEKQCLKNFFLRNMFIPSELGDEKSILHNVAIIYYNNEYYFLKEYGQELCKLSGQMNNSKNDYIKRG